MIELVLPYPPSVNRAYRSVGHRVLLSRAARQYRAAVYAAVLDASATPFGAARLWLRVDLYPPDRRRRDIDNAIKAIGDALQKAGLFDDDEQIDCWIICRQRPIRPGRAVVYIGQRGQANE